jgi:GT2 family glycosyltransferase
MPRLLTVSIVTYNGAGKITKCLQSLHSQTFEDFDVLVVDNASSDGTLVEVDAAAPEARVIALTENVGFGAGHNAAIRATQTPFVLVLNQDVVLESNALQRLVDAARLHEDTAAIGPCLYRGEGPKPTEVMDTGGLHKSFYYGVSDRGAGKTRNDRLSQAGLVWGISGACMLLRRSALESVAYPGQQKQYFDESFFMYKEDVDLCARLNARGWKSWYEPTAIGWHTRTGFGARAITQTPTHRKTIPRYVNEYSYRNHWLFLFKNAPLILFPVIAVYEALKALYVLVFEPKTLRVIPEILSLLPLMLRRRYANTR